FHPRLVESDGTDLWVANEDGNSVSRVRASDGRLLETWTDAPKAWGVLVARGMVFVTGRTSPGSLYLIYPTLPAGAVTTVTSSLGGYPKGITYDGQRIWTADSSGSVSIVTLSPLGVVTVTGFGVPTGIIFDGANIWMSDGGTLKKLDSGGN